MSRLLIAFLLVAILARGLFWLSGKLAPYGLAFDDGDTVILLGFGWQAIRQCWHWWLAGALLLGLLILLGYGLGSLENRWQRKRIQQLLKALNDQSQRLAPFMGHDRTPHPPWSGRIAVAPLGLLDTPDNSFAEIIRSLHQELGGNKRDFQRVMRPVLNRYAAYVHRLPSSTGGAYREQGGLLRQGLDNAVVTVRRGRETVLAHGFPSQQECQKPQWLLACALAGLLTGVDKVLLKWAVSDPGDRHRWRPHQQPLANWLDAHKLEEYCLRPANDQGPPLGTLLVERILKPEGWSALDADIQTVLLEVLGGTSNHPLAALTKKVYQHNREQDRQAGQEVSPPASSIYDQSAEQGSKPSTRKPASSDCAQPTMSQDPSAEPALSSALLPEQEEAQPDPSIPVIETSAHESTTRRQAGHETRSGIHSVQVSENNSLTFPRR